MDPLVQYGRKYFFDPGHPSGGPLGGPDAAAPSSTMGDLHRKTNDRRTPPHERHERHTRDRRETDERHTRDTPLSRPSWRLKLGENVFQTKLRLRFFLEKFMKKIFQPPPEKIAVSRCFLVVAPRSLVACLSLSLVLKKFKNLKGEKPKSLSGV